MVSTSVILQMMRNRVFEVKDEYCLYLDKVEDKLEGYKSVSLSTWMYLFRESGLPQEEYDNFNKIWIEAYVRYYFFKEALKDLPNTTDLNMVKRIVTVDDFAYPTILKLKLAYVYGDKISDYDSLVTKWISNEHVVKWIKYKSYRKLDEYWDMKFASDNSVFRSILNYRRCTIEGLDTTDQILKSAKNLNSLTSVLQFNLYCYNSMLMPRVDIGYIKKKYNEFCTDEKSRKYVSEIFEALPEFIMSLNAYSTRLVLEYGTVKREMAEKNNLTSEDKSSIESILNSLWQCVELYSTRIVVDYYFREREVDNIKFFGNASEFSMKTRYLKYAAKHCRRFPSSFLPEFDKVNKEEFTEDEFIQFVRSSCDEYNPPIKEAWTKAVMQGFYIPIFIKQTLEQFCDTNELLMNLTADDVSNRDFFTIIVYYYMTDTSIWELLRDTRVSSLLNNGLRKYWYDFVCDDANYHEQFINKSIPGNISLFGALGIDDSECNRYLVSNDLFNLYIHGIKDRFRNIVNFRLFLERRLYENLIDIDAVKHLLREYPEYIESAFNDIVKHGMTRFSRESIDLILDCCLTCYLAYGRKNESYLTFEGKLHLKDECLKEIIRPLGINNHKAADIFFGK